VTQKINGHYYVTAVLNSTPAEKAGIVLGDRLIEVNGQLFHPVRSFENMAGRKLRITIQRGSSTATRRTLNIIPVDIKERELFENDSMASVEIIEYKDCRFAYTHLWWLSGLAMRQVFASALNMAEASEGLIIDIRDGFGGGPYIEYIDPFLRSNQKQIMVESIYRNNKEKYNTGFNKPVIVLINGGSRSGKEVLAYCFKKWNKALLVGQRTAGYVTGGNMKQISKESFLYFGACMKVIDGKRLEGIGVEPDIEVYFDVRLAAGRDVQLERAKDEMVRLIESGY
jgi:carboxyl-terminal processing protease